MSNLAPHLHPSLGRAKHRDGLTHVTILLATYNGGRMLQPQLDSFLRQTHKDWSLIVSDDGSTDDTRDTVQEFARLHPNKRITLIRGPQNGSAQNFLSLLRAAGGTPFIAFSDQDDVWLADKLARAIDALQGCEGPAGYGSSTIIADTDLTPLRFSLKIRKTPSFANALVQNIAGGNTMVFNRAAMDKLQPASRLAGRIVAHDWWCYQIVTGIGGDLIFDPIPGLLYRQHSANQIGANDTVPAMVARLRRLADGEFSKSLDAQFAALEAAKHWLSDDAIRALETCRALRSTTMSERLAAYLHSGIHRQTARGSLALVVAALLGRL